MRLKARTVARGLPALLQGLLKMLFFAKQSHLIPAARPRLRSGDLSYNGGPGWYYALLAQDCGNAARTRDPERHVFTDKGSMLNPILNSKTSAVAVFARFRQAGLQLITHANMQRAVSTPSSSRASSRRSMYFDGDLVT